ncbi:AhpC/TSA family protein [Chitinophaga sp. Mgbs1]|uniref:AhpC/TSA family protein n=1 Tax=Chitinophaga solisilvae TaxID=1233460 RepID=A0A9Q5GS07_9BACT|nr:AhpC/TSA family protein [Chitinophaga solisilvae]
MKKICIAICLLPLQTAIAQQFTLKGSVQQTTYAVSDFVYLTYRQQHKTILDSCRLEGTKYHFSGQLQYPAEAKLYLKVADSTLQYYNTTHFIKPFECTFYLDAGSLTATSKENLYETIISGSAAQDDRQLLRKELHEINDRADAAYGKEREAAYKANDKAAIAIVSRKMTATGEEEKAAQLRFIQQHPKTGIMLDLLAEYTRTKIDPAVIGPVYEQMLPALKASPEGKAYGIRLEKARKIATGMPAPPVVLKDRNGKTIRLSDLRGKVVLLDFWGSWCYPCRMTHPHLRETYARYRDKGFEILGVSNERGDTATRYAKWTKALDEDNMTWLNVINENTSTEKDKGVLDNYDVKAFPTKFLIGRDGRIIIKLVGNTPQNNEELEAQLKKMMENV